MICLWNGWKKSQYIILQYSTYHDNILLWLKYRDNIVSWDFWRFSAFYFFLFQSPWTLCPETPECHVSAAAWSSAAGCSYLVCWSFGTDGTEHLVSVCAGRAHALHPLCGLHPPPFDVFLHPPPLLLRVTSQTCFDSIIPSPACLIAKIVFFGH